MGVPIPPATNKGHFHIGNDEFWFILEGKIAYEMEGKGLLVSQAGDVVLALPGRFHRASWAPGQMDTRLACTSLPMMGRRADFCLGRLTGLSMAYWK